ncbi:MAG: radical SAM protein [Myxococcota bacterium]
MDPVRIVFVSQGPSFEASSTPFRLLRNYACLDERVAERCEFIHHPVLAVTHRDRQAHARACIDTARQIIAQSPTIVGLSLYCWNAGFLLAVAAVCKKLRPELTIVAGGPDTYGESESLLSQHSQLDYVIDGEGEQAFRRFLLAWLGLAPSTGLTLAGEAGFHGVPFIAFRNGDEIVRGKRRDYIENLDEIPSPILGATVQELLTRFHREGRPSVIVETSRGCPVNCAFCQYPKNDGGRMRYFDIDRVLQELAHVRDLGIKSVYFADGILTVRKERAFEIFRFFLEEFTDGNLHTEIKLDMLPDLVADQCRELFRQGRLHFGVGLQSVNRQTLKTIGRPTSLQRLEGNIRKLGENPNLRWDLIYGLPGDTLQDFLEGIDYIQGVQPGAPMALQPLQVLPGTEFRATAKELGLRYDDVSPHVTRQTPQFSPADMLRAHLVSMLIEQMYPVISRLFDTYQVRPGGAFFTEIFTASFFDALDDHALMTNVARFGRALSAWAQARAPDPEAAAVVRDAIEYRVVESLRDQPEHWHTLTSLHAHVADESRPEHRFRFEHDLEVPGRRAAQPWHVQLGAEAIPA